MLAQPRHDPALVGDAVGDRTVEGERMAPPRLVEPPTQDFVLAIEEQELGAGSFGGRTVRDQLEQMRRIECAGSAVDADRQILVGAIPRADQAAEQSDGQVVDRLETTVLERFQCRRPTRAGHPGHQHDQAHRDFTRPAPHQAPA